MPRKMTFSAKAPRPKNIDLIIPGLGRTGAANPNRFQVSSGVRDRKSYDQLCSMVKDLGARLMFEPLLAVQRGDRSLRELYAAYRAGSAAMRELLENIGDERMSSHIDGYIVQLRAERLKTVEKVQMQLQRFMDFCGGPSVARLSHLEPDTITRFLARLQAGEIAGAGPASAATSNRYRAAISGLATYLESRGLIKRHPIRRIVSKAPEAEPRMPTFTAANYRDYLELLTEELDGTVASAQPYQLFVRLLIHTGADVGELLARRASDVRLMAPGERPQITLKRLKTNTPERVVPIPALLRAELASHLAQFGLMADAPLFGMISRVALERAHRRVRRTIGLPALRLKDFRHVAAIMWRKGGADLQTIQEWLGHATPLQTVVYSRFKDGAELQGPMVDQAAGLLMAELDVPRIQRLRGASAAV